MLGKADEDVSEEKLTVPPNATELSDVDYADEVSTSSKCDTSPSCNTCWSEKTNFNGSGRTVSKSNYMWKPIKTVYNNTTQHLLLEDWELSAYRWVDNCSSGKLVWNKAKLWPKGRGREELDAWLFAERHETDAERWTELEDAEPDALAVDDLREDTYGRWKVTVFFLDRISRVHGGRARRLPLIKGLGSEELEVEGRQLTIVRAADVTPFIFLSFDCCWSCWASRKERTFCEILFGTQNKSSDVFNTAHQTLKYQTPSTENINLRS